MSKQRLKLRELRKILKSFGVQEDVAGGKGSHIKFYKQLADGCPSYPVPNKTNVLPCYVKGARRKFRLMPEEGVSDADFFGRK